MIEPRVGCAAGRQATIQKKLMNPAIAARESHMLQNSKSGLMKKEILYKCVGIERFLCLHTARQAVQMQRAHSEIVLSAQRIQKGKHRIMKISEIVKMSSRWASEWAIELAEIYATSYQ